MIERSTFLYQIRTYNTDGDLTGVFDDCISLYYRKQVNHIGICIATVPADHRLVNTVGLDNLMEVYISVPYPNGGGGGGQCEWSQDFLGIFRDYQVATDDNGDVYYLLYFPSAMEILSRYNISWPAGTSGKTQWGSTKYSVIANDLVRWNATEEALEANGRLRDINQVWSLNDAGAVATSNTVDFAISNRNLLDAQQEIAKVGNFDFDVVIQGGAYPPILDYQQYQTQLGSDLTGSILFNVALGNLYHASFGGDKVNEKTVAIVGGRGEGDQRTFAIEAGTNYNTLNEYEVFVDARDKDDAELSAIGQSAIEGLRSRSQFTGELTSTFGYMYKRDFGLGDIVPVMLGNESADRKIDVVEVKFDQNQSVEIRCGIADTVTA